MRPQKYLYDFVIQIALIVVVVALFRTNPDKLHASFWAAALFVLMPLSMLSREWIFYRFTNKVWWASVLQFWLFFAVPIFVLRILHPRTSLDEVSVGFMPVSFWHQASNISYLFMMSATLWSYWNYRKKEKSPGSKT